MGQGRHTLRSVSDPVYPHKTTAAEPHYFQQSQYTLFTCYQRLCYNIHTLWYQHITRILQKMVKSDRTINIDYITLKSQD